MDTKWLFKSASSSTKEKPTTRMTPGLGCQLCSRVRLPRSLVEAERDAKRTHPETHGAHTNKHQSHVPRDRRRPHQHTNTKRTQRTPRPTPRTPTNRHPPADVPRFADACARDVSPWARSSTSTWSTEASAEAIGGIGRKDHQGKGGRRAFGRRTVVASHAAIVHSINTI